ncbi:flagellar M-ring protein FliF [Izhakiella capsodis]|uniref:Flagellar M-ring protein n=1 Tax=Izhakiella capsodis TaxID=1367852 RepID=A0A1I4YBW0_9GAMM|nr:flagellar basal-body MS-ring/collar protein FliF [Izhakiella capsodis]SFN35476.1 flagellar M-ring protein FliF [Izhakiella capsodis]
MFNKFKARLPADSLVMLKRFALPGALALAVTAAIVALLWQNNRHYTMLFGTHENISVSDVVGVLSSEGISYRVEPQSGALLVQENQLSKARMALAAKGISARLPAGYELMDKEEMLGGSQFVQNVRLKRSLEGELAQSIMTLDAVDYARVLLGISETSSFVLTNKPDSSASVMLRLKYGRQLSNEQVAAIVSLVSGSLPGLKPEQVKVVDQAGNLLSANVSEWLDGGYGLQGSAEMVQHIRQQTERNIANLLIPVLGADNFRVSVVPRVDFSQVQETQERYLNEPHLAEENLLQENTSEALAMGIPGSLSNTPANTANNKKPAEQNDNAQQNSQPLSTRNQARRQYHWDRDIRNIHHQNYQLQRLTVAVLINQDAPQLKTWDEQQLKQMQQLLDHAAGIDSIRGDELSLSRIAFTKAPEYQEPVLPWWQRPSTLWWAERGGIGLLALLIILFGILPLMRRWARPPDKVAISAANSEPVSADESGNHQGEMAGGATFEDDEQLPPQSSGLETKIAFLQTLAKNETDRVADVLKQWISSNERNAK